MLIIKKLPAPADTVSQEWCVRCNRLNLPPVVEEVVQDIIRYATYPVGAYRTKSSGEVEYLVEFETTDGFVSSPKFYTIDGLRNAVRHILHPYHRIDTS